MVWIPLLLIVGGIGLTQAASNPTQVTLRWLRLGGIIAIALLAVSAAAAVLTKQGHGLFWIGWGATLLAFVIQLVTVQLGKRQLQRLAAAAGFILAGLTVWMVLSDPVTGIRAKADLAANPSILEVAPEAEPAPTWGLMGGDATTSPLGLVNVLLSSGLWGGMLMTMLLGHAYLTAGGEMTQAPFQRLVLLMGGLLGVRLLGALWLGLWPHLHTQQHGIARVWTTMMVTGRFGVGLLVPAVFIYMTYDCVKRHANQSATGILYVACVLVLMGEGIALALQASTGLLF